MGDKKDETFEMLFSMKNKMDHFFAVSEAESPPYCMQSGSQWSLAVDLFDTGAEYLVAIDLPGVEKDKLNLSVTVDKIIIKGRREEGFMVPGSAEVICLERGHGHFERVIRLPDPVDVDQVKAVFKHGVLRVKAVKKSVDSAKKNIVIE